jgi:hypothetical protein
VVAFEMATVQQVKQALEQCVVGGRCQFLTYGEFSKQFGFGPFPLAWANKTMLDEVEAALKGEPNGLDLTFLLRNTDTGYPSVTDGLQSKPPSPQQMVRARAVAQQIIDRYCPGAANPY